MFNRTINNVVIKNLHEYTAILSHNDNVKISVLAIRIDSNFEYCFSKNSHLINVQRCTRIWGALIIKNSLIVQRTFVILFTQNRNR